MLTENSRIAAVAFALWAAVPVSGAPLRQVQAGSGSVPQATIPIELLQAPTGANAAQPNLSADARGNIYLVWTERSAGAPPSLKFARYDGTAWGPARVVASGRGIVASAADLPSVLALPGGRLAVHWQQVGAEGSRGYGVRVSQSSDAGATWSTPVVPHPSHEIGENGFVSLYATEGDSVGVIWLDGRGFTSRAAAATASTTLMSAKIGRNGGLSSETTLDERVCDCCHTDLAMTADGPLLVYRDRAPGEVRDIVALRRSGNTFEVPRAVSNDGWVTRSCPVNGPSVAAVGRRVAVAWFTAALDTTRVLVSLSNNSGRDFGRPTRIDEGDPLGRVAVAMTDSATTWVSWLERVPGYNAQLRLRRVSANGSRSPAYALAEPNLTHTTGFPQMVASGGSLFLAWSTAAETGAPPTIRVARIRPPSR